MSKAFCLPVLLGLAASAVLARELQKKPVSTSPVPPPAAVPVLTR